MSYMSRRLTSVIVSRNDVDGVRDVALAIRVVHGYGSTLCDPHLLRQFRRLPPESEASARSQSIRHRINRNDSSILRPPVPADVPVIEQFASIRTVCSDGLRD
jgi:hypothetical protein